MTNKNPTSTSDYYCLQISTNSSISCESDLSSFSSDKEVDTLTSRLHSDELPAFEIRLISPLGRSPSPIDSETDYFSSPTHSSCITPTRPATKRPPTNYQSNENFITLHDINAQISPPSDTDSNPLSDSNRTNSLETIFEGVFLNTPPKERPQRRSNNFRSNLMEKIAINRLNSIASSGKENIKESGDDQQLGE